MRLTNFASTDPACFRPPDPADEHLPDGPNRRWPNFIHHGKARSICYPEHWGPLSIKCVFKGQEIYKSGRIRYPVSEDAYLILNKGQYYSSSIQTREETESFIVFFRPQFAEEVLSSLVIPSDRLLDEPGKLVEQPVTFFEGLHPHDQIVSPLLRHIASTSAQGIVTSGWYEEQFHLLLERMLVAHRGIGKEMQRLEAKRASTRIELYRRLRLSRDFIDANYQQNLLLSDMAGVACLTPHHYLRLFKKAFCVTPHQYMTGKRLELARKLLKTTDESVTDICFTIGFESLGSFSTLFHRSFGAAPSVYRERSA